MDFAAQRRNMVDNQILPNKVTDERLVEAMETLPREAFVPKDKQGIAYVDEAVPLGRGRYLLEPMVAAKLIQAVDAKPDDLALVIGCGTGYEGAVLSYKVGTVVAVESDSGLAQHAAQTLGSLEIDTVAIIEGPLTDGCPDQAPFDVIVINGAVAEIPDAVTEQLADGGRLVAVVLDPVMGEGLGHATLVTRHRSGFSRRRIFDAGTPRLPGFERAPSFVF